MTRIRLFWLIPILLFVSSASAEALAFIANFGSDDVTVIDTTDHTVVATIDVGDAPVGVAISPDGSEVYVSNSLSNDLSIIDADQLAVVATVNLGAVPLGMDLSPDGNTLYVANNSDDTVSVVDVVARQVVATVPAAGAPIDIAALPNGAKVYALGELGTITVFDPTDFQVLQELSSTATYNGIAAHPDSSSIFFVSPSGQTVTMIDTDDGTPPTSLAIGGSPKDIAFDADGSHFYVAQGNSDLMKFDGVSLSVVDTAETGPFPVAVDVTDDGESVYVADLQNNDVTVLNAATLDVVDVLPVGLSPQTIGQFIGPERLVGIGIPTISPWGLGAMAFILAFFSIRRLGRTM